MRRATSLGRHATREQHVPDRERDPDVEGADPRRPAHEDEVGGYARSSSPHLSTVHLRA